MPERRPRKTAPRVTVPEKLTAKDRAEFGAQQAQAEAEGVELPFDDKVDFMGSKFRMAQSIGLWPLIAFSMAQKRGDNVDPKSLATIGVMVLDCLDTSEHDRFAEHATEKKAGAQELMTLVQQVIEVVSARPSRPPGDSSAGRQTTSENSKELSSARAKLSPEELDRLT